MFSGPILITTCRLMRKARIHFSLATSHEAR
jgi:hypothetical protein